MMNTLFQRTYNMTEENKTKKKLVWITIFSIEVLKNYVWNKSPWCYSEVILLCKLNVI
jgi:cAMP phosphodiesterase